MFIRMYLDVYNGVNGKIEFMYDFFGLWADFQERNLLINHGRGVLKNK